MYGTIARVLLPKTTCDSDIVIAYETIIADSEKNLLCTLSESDPDWLMLLSDSASSNGFECVF